MNHQEGGEVMNESEVFSERSPGLQTSQTDISQPKKVLPAIKKEIPKTGKRRSRLLRCLAATTVPIFVVLVTVSAGLDTKVILQPSLLFLLVDTLFLFIMTLLVAYVSARSYFASGSLSLLLLGTGALAFGSTNQATGWMLGVSGRTEVFLIVSTIGLLFVSLLHLVNATSVIGRVTSGPTQRRRWLKVVLAYSGVLIFTGVLVVMVLRGVVSPVVVQRIGQILFRQETMVVVVALFLISSALSMRFFFKSKLTFTYWYSLGLALLAIGSWVMFAQQAVGSVMLWVARSAQHLGTIYFLVAGLSGLRGTTVQAAALDEKNEKNKDYQDLLEKTGPVIYTADKDGVITHVNSAAETLLSYSPSELSGRPFADLIYPDDLERHSTNFRRLLAGYSERDLYRISTKTGEIRWVYTVTRPLFSEGGVVGIRGMLTDVTEIKKKEETAVQEYELLRSLIDNVPDLVYFKDEKNRFIRVNKAKAEFAGTVPQRMIGKAESEFVPREEAEAASIHENWIKKFNKPLVNKLQKIRRAKGTRHWVSATRIPRHNDKGQVIGTMGVSRDVTEYKQFEKRLRDSLERLKMSLEFIPDGICLTDLQGTVVDTNREAERLLGCGGGEIIGKNLLKLQVFSADQIQKMTTNLAKSAQGQSTGPDEFPLKTKGGGEITVVVRTHPINVGGKSWVLVAVRDISELKSAERARIRLEKAKARREIAKQVAQDLNDPLATILGNTQLLEVGAQTYKAEEIKKRLRIIAQTASEIGKKVRDMQLFTCSELSTRNFSMIDLNEVVRSAVAATSSRWRDKAGAEGVAIRIKGKLEELPCFLGSRSELMDVLTNLIFNAVEAIPKGGDIFIRTEAKDKEILLHFSDTGEGIPDNIKERIFDPFFTTKGPKAAGLGLSMSYGIIKRHQGKITVESAQTKGTTVTVSIPIRRQSDLEKECKYSRSES